MMRRRFLRGASLVPLFLTFLLGCRDEDPTSVDFKFDPELAVVPEVVCMAAGDSIQFVAFFADNRGVPLPTPPGYEMTWRSSNPEVARVTAYGKLVALAQGQVRVTAAYGRYSATAMIWVSEPSAGAR